MSDEIPPEVTEARLRITEDELRAGKELSSLLTDDEIAALRQRLTDPVLLALLDEAVEEQREEPMNDGDELAPCEVACCDTNGDRVYVLIGGAMVCPHGHEEEFLSIGVRDSKSTDEVVSRNEYRELINLDPIAAIHLARTLLDFATDMLDADANEDDEHPDPTVN